MPCPRDTDTPHVQDTTAPSAVIRLLDLVWSQANTATNHSWERLNHAMHAALRMAIGAGFTFALDDLATIAAQYRFGYWCGESPEWIYTAAVVASNRSAIQSYEAWKQRKPFVMDDVRLGHVHRKRERLTVGSRFVWQGYEVTVTSFSANGQSLTACSYQPRVEGSYMDVIEKRFRITHADITAERKERHERGALIAQLTAAARADATRAAILAALGVTTRAELDRVPLARLRKVAAQYPALP